MAKRRLIIFIRIVLTILFLIASADFIITNTYWLITNLFSHTLTKSCTGILIDLLEIVYIVVFIAYFNEVTKKIDCSRNQSK